MSDAPRPYSRGQLAGLRKELRSARPTSEKRRLLATVDTLLLHVLHLEQTLSSVSECPECDSCRCAARVVLRDRP